MCIYVCTYVIIYVIVLLHINVTRYFSFFFYVLHNMIIIMMMMMMIMGQQAGAMFKTSFYVAWQGRELQPDTGCI